MGVLAALIFALQMINFSIPGGTSGHLLGGALSSIIVGPCGSTIILSVVLIVQALIFNDGCLTALGANIFNMAIIGTFSSYFVYYLIRKISRSRIKFYIAIATASWFSVVLASLFAALELGISGTYEMGITIKAMVFVHMIIGIGEAIITTAIIAFVDRIRPELILTGEITGERSL
jgi:cobalt/nickel transport system permease protein